MHSILYLYHSYCRKNVSVPLWYCYISAGDQGGSGPECNITLARHSSLGHRTGNWWHRYQASDINAECVTSSLDVMHNFHQDRKYEHVTGYVQWLSSHLENKSDIFETMLILSTLLVISQYSSVVFGQGIRSYRGKAEFKKVTLLWTLDPSSQLQKSSVFRIKFCENQIWGEHYCREQEVPGSRAQKSFSTKIHGELWNNGNNSLRESRL